MKMNRIANVGFGVLALLAALPLSAVNISDLLNPDDVMLRKPSTAKPVPTKAEVKPAPVEKLVVVETNVVTEVVKETNVVTEVVLATNVVTEVVTATNYVTQTDVVITTNVVSSLDESAQRALEDERNQAVRDAAVERSARQSAEAARSEAEKRVVAERLARTEAEAEIERMKAEFAKVEAARREAEAKLRAAETQAAVAEKKAAAAETAREVVASQVDEVARRALAERKARERAEAETRAAERRAETERNAALAVAKQLEAATNQPPTAAEPPKAQATVEKPAGGKKLTGRDAIITAERMDFDRKEGVILFDRNVYVDDEQYQMHADRLFVFLETNAVATAKGGKSKDGAAAERKSSGGGVAGISGGKTSLKRLVAIGRVSITNEQRSAYCARATYAKKSGKIVMYGNDEITPWILDPQQSATPQYGEKITFWTISQQVEIEKPVLSGAAFGKGKGAANPLDVFKKSGK